MAQEMKCERRQGVLSRGRIVQQGSHQRAFYSKDQDPVRYDLKVPGMSQRHLVNASSNSSSQKEVGEFLLSFDPRATMAPLARLLVFYVREDGEIVADARMFRIAHCLLNKVNLQFRHEQQYPSTEASMLLTASPSSLCGVGLVDKSVRLLRKKEQFSRRNQNPEWIAISFDYITPYSRHYSDHVDTSMAFEEAGMVVITNFELENRPCVISQPAVAYWNRMDLIMPARDFGGERSYDLSSIKAMREEEPPKSIEKKPAEATKPTEAEEIRNYFPETWLWEMHPIGSSGQVVIKRKLPHTITKWVGGAVCVHHKTGLGLWEETSVTAFQPFFVSFTLPYSVVRGEVLPLTVSVFNYLSECLPIKLSLETSEEYRIVSDNRWHKMCVCGGESRSHRFSIEPTALGKVNITVYGFSLEEDDGDACGNEVTARLSARDAVSKQLLVEAEGFPKEEVFNYFVCPENTNGTYATEVDLLLPEDVVDGSGRAYVSVTGDLMGPALSGLSGLVRLPMGCGEQNMILFTPNIFVLDYLTSTGRITDEIKDNCLKNMKIGYQRELTYRHKDGSYSAFGSSDPEGSLWLTAFVVRQFENGCFEPSGKVIHKAMKGGLTDGEHSLAPLTAYVLISLLESWIVPSEQPAMRTALKCLETEENPSSYSLSLFAYASSLANEKRAAYLYLKQLEDRAIIKDGLMYWDTSSQNGGSKSVSIEIAGYYIMSRVNLDGRDSTGPVMSVIRWITNKGTLKEVSFPTQDTVVALQALAKYSALQAASATDIGLVVESDELVKGFKVDEDNKLVTQTAQIPVLPAVVDLQAVGDGCTLVQFSMRYNVEKGFGSEAFDLDIKTVRLGSSKCNLPRLDICMRYKIPNQKTNMVVVSVKMPSGYIPDGWSLLRSVLNFCIIKYVLWTMINNKKNYIHYFIISQLHSNTAVQLKRHELDGNQVNLYFNELTNEAKCFMFFIKSEAEVEDIKPSSVKLYDYYQPELEITKEYTIPMTCTMIPLPDILDELDELPGTTMQPDGKEEPPITLPSHNENPITVEESTEILTTAMPEGSVTSTEDISSTDFGQKYTHTEATTQQGTFTFRENTNHVQASYTTDSELTVDDIATDKTQTEDITQVFTTSPTSRQIAMADDAGIFQTENNTNHLVNFVDLDISLDLPDGIEGNVPVSVLPPVKIQFENCPVCTEHFPENFRDIYCNSAFGLRVTKFAKLEYDSECPCPQLQEKGSIHFIMGSPTDLWSSELDKHRIHLTNQVYVIASPSKTVQPEVLKQARRDCNNDP
ncbi:alpha-1-inhibitor 3 [Caerostris extrusa]|uniref:Alpha-1-inhibitor 3 n=1 Tax=Caerostris extrusa TaxID=172846 RepID=A0AAV4T1K3_CAEEX|nr:alpha-1-inhibitor 3 [Caerostris extrusa]